jgi:NAD(P)-dependent dehydrogenase (short-subunit alcohol dehydrogenase family)
MAAHLAVEETDITSVSFGPGRVDTDMQGVIREKGKDSMDQAMHQNFVDAHEQGELLRPEQPGNVIAKFVANPLHKLSGQYIRYVRRPESQCQLLTIPSWNSPELAAYQQ